MSLPRRDWRPAGFQDYTGELTIRDAVKIVEGGRVTLADPYEQVIELAFVGTT